MVSAGEASGDAHAAEALEALRARHPERGVTSFGMGAGALRAAGTELVVDCRELSVIGFVDVLLNYPRFLARLRRLREALRARRPDVLLICDYPDFNLKLAETARECGVPVLMYVAPQVWAWRAGRIPRIRALVDHLAVLFPFEERLWREAGVPVTCVGHPAARAIVPEADAARRARSALELDAEVPLLALLPGSRAGEIRRLLPPMLDAVARLVAARPTLACVLPVAPTLDMDVVRAHLDAAAAEHPRAGLRTRVHLVQGSSVLVARASDAAVVASGTATLETALAGTPMVVVYRTHPLNAMIFARLVRLEHVALPNIVVGRTLVPELLQERADGPGIARAVGELLDDPEARMRMREALGEVRAALGEHGDAAATVAGLLDELAGGRTG